MYKIAHIRKQSTWPEKLKLSVTETTRSFGFTTNIMRCTYVSLLTRYLYNMFSERLYGSCNSWFLIDVNSKRVSSRESIQIELEISIIEKYAIRYFWTVAHLYQHTMDAPNISENRSTDTILSYVLTIFWFRSCLILCTVLCIVFLMKRFWSFKISSPGFVVHVFVEVDWALSSI